MSNRLNIFDILAKLDKNDINVRNSFKNSELKEFDSFIGYPALRWMSGSNDETMHLLCLLNTNEINDNYFDLWKHKEFQSKIIALAGAGMWTKHVYIKPPVNKRASKLYELVHHYYPDFDYEDCDFFLERCTVDDVKELALSSGLYDDNKSVKPVVDEFKKYMG